MQTENGPMFRKAPVPWYDSTGLCIAVALMMLAVFLFGIAGIRVAPEYNDPRILWVPVTLCIFSALVFLSIVLRILKRTLS